MSSQELVSASNGAQENQIEQSVDASQPEDSPPLDQKQTARRLSPFWHDRLVEVGMVCAMAGYYVVGNNHLGASKIFHINPLLSLPFLLAFAVLSWYRLAFAVALVPMAVPYYYLEKPIYGHYEFELAEIALGVCVAIALVQALLRGKSWEYWLSWRELRDRLGPFIFPIAVFLLAAGISVLIAFTRRVALRSFREEVFDPVVYMLLAFYCLRTRRDVARLLVALFAAAFIVAIEGLAQYFLFKRTLALDSNGRVHAIFGSANDIGLFFDYALPIGLALVIIGRRHVSGFAQSWGARLVALAMLLPMLAVLYLSQSRGAWVAIGIAGVAIVLLALRDRKLRAIAAIALLVVCAVVAALFYRQLLDYFVGGHVSAEGISTVTKRLYLWQSTLRIIHQYPIFGVGLDNFLCYYSRNTICVIPTLHGHYWITTVPGTHMSTGLSEEPNLSHPHNIFLHVWVSMGIFGLLAFVALVALFFWLFARILKAVRANGGAGQHDFEWMVIGTGAAMLAGLIQGQVDNAFLAQDMAFCFWTLVAALLLLRVLTGTPWRGRPKT